MDFTDFALILISVALLLISISLGSVYRALRDTSGQRMAKSIDDAIERLGAATRHFTEVNAVLALTEQFQDRPELMQRLSEFSSQTIAAALMVRINGVASDIKMAQAQLSRHRKGALDGYSTYPAAVARDEQMLQHLHQELDALHALNRMVATKLTSVS